MYSKLSVLIILGIVLNSCLKNDNINSNAAAAADLIESLERYSVSVLRPNVDYTKVSAKYKSDASENIDEEQFFELTQDFLLTFYDPHVSLSSSFDTLRSIDYLNYTKNINSSTVENGYLQNIKQHQSNILSATINDTIGYLYLSDFMGDRAEVESILHRIIDDFSSKSGLIIDLRDNNGGSAYNAQSLLNKLTNEDLPWHTTQNKTKNGFDNVFEWNIGPAGNFQFTKKVIVLTGKYTISAGERFTMGAKILPHVKIIGDTTANTQGSVMGREMYNGWKYTFTFEKCLAADGTNYEGVGIPPDIYYDSKTLDLTSSDVIIERAIVELQ